VTLTTRNTLRRAIAGALVVSAIAPPAAAAQQDLPMLDAHDAALQKRSDAGRLGLWSESHPDRSTATASAPDGFDWSSALLGAAAGAGGLLALGAATTMSRRLRVVAR
jgi:hypothetical protein